MWYNVNNNGGMMKKIILILMLIIVQPIVFANWHDVFVANLQYDWIDKSEVEKEAIISEVHDIIFQESETLEKKSVKKENKDWLKDKDYVEHYMAASAGYKEYKNFNISAFYNGKSKYIYMYALQDKQDLSKSYYYDALGHLKYIDYIYGDYPEYPYYALQYRVSGKPVSAVYYVSKDNQYLYTPKGEFQGVWYKHNMYDKHSKIILKRTAY